MGKYLRPAALNEALAALNRQTYVVLAGGTDFFPARVDQPRDENVLDISRLNELRGITETADSFRFGALCTWTDIIREELPACFDGLKQAALQVGGIQTQNAGTLCGNICNASPAADSVPNLLALNAVVEISSLNQKRRLPVAQFILGNRKTALKPGELVTGLVIPKLGPSARSGFEKLGARKYLVISIVMAGAVMCLDETHCISDLRVAVGACSPVAKRLFGLEQESLGRKPGDVLVEPRHLQDLAPIDDVRAPASYRMEVTAELVQRTLIKASGAVIDDVARKTA